MNNKSIVLLSMWPFLTCSMNDMPQQDRNLRLIRKLISKPKMSASSYAKSPVIAADDPGCIAYHEALQESNDDDAITLIEAGLNIEAKFDGTLGNALTLACLYGRIRVAQTLFAKGARISPDLTLHHVVEYPLIVEFLIEKMNLSPNARRKRYETNCNLETPIVDAIAAHATQTVAILLRNGADPNKRFYDDTLELSPLALAEAGRNQEIIALLKEKNATSFKRETGESARNRQTRDMLQPGTLEFELSLPK